MSRSVQAAFWPVPDERDLFPHVACGQRVSQSAAFHASVLLRDGALHAEDHETEMGLATLERMKRKLQSDDVGIIQSDDVGGLTDHHRTGRYENRLRWRFGAVQQPIEKTCRLIADVFRSRAHAGKRRDAYLAKEFMIADAHQGNIIRHTQAQTTAGPCRFLPAFVKSAHDRNWFRR